MHYETQDRERFLVRGLVRQNFFSGPTRKSDWFPETFSVNQGISCPGVNREKLPAKCLLFPVMVRWCLAGSFTQLPSKSSLSLMSVNFLDFLMFFRLQKSVQIANKTGIIY